MSERIINIETVQTFGFLTVGMLLWHGISLVGAKPVVILFLFMMLLYALSLKLFYSTAFWASLIFSGSIISFYFRSQQVIDLPFAYSEYRSFLLMSQMLAELFAVSYMVKLARQKKKAVRSKLNFARQFADLNLFLTLVYWIFYNFFGLKNFYDQINGTDFQAAKFAGFSTEPGPLTFTLLVYLAIVLQEDVKFRNLRVLVLLFLISVTGSSIVICLPLVFLIYAKLRNALKIWWVFLFSLAIFLGFSTSILGKLELLINPQEGLGRYSANLLILYELLENPFAINGLNSFDTVRRASEYAYLTPSDMFHHGGSDIAHILIDWNMLIGSLLIVMILIVLLKHSQSWLLLMMLIILSIKGQGMFSAGYLMCWLVLVLLAKKNTVESAESSTQIKPEK